MSKITIPTDFASLIGNEAVKRYLTQVVKKKGLHHSLLFSGPDGIGKSLFAQVLAANLICQGDQAEQQRQKFAHGNHPDLHIYRPEGKLGMHSIHSLRQLADEVHLPPFEGAWKVFILHDAERMLPSSANALLKTFEEPPPDTIIILLTSAPQSLLPTVLSRCCKVSFAAIAEDEIAAFIKQHESIDDMARAYAIAARAQGSLSRAIRLAKPDGDPYRAILLEILSRGRFDTYKELTKAAATLAEKVEEIKKKADEGAREAIYKAGTENLSAGQQNSLEKEVEGLTAMQVGHEVEALFEHVLSWYRDLQLLQSNGNLSYLINRDAHAALEQQLQSGNLMSLEMVLQALGDARLSFKRSTAVNICLENLFLKLNLL